MNTKFFSIASTSMIVLAMIVAPMFIQAAPGPIFEPPGGGGSSEKPGGDDTEYEWFPGDPAYLECERVGGGDYLYSVRIGTGSALDPLYGMERTVYGNTITVEGVWEEGGLEEVSFDWYSDPDPIGIVIVKSGAAAVVYYYPPETYDGQDLSAYGDWWEPSHLTFCWGDAPEPPGPPVCEWVDETAWGAGYPYNVDEQGNWGTYTPYPVIIDGVAYDGVTIWAGQHMDAGTVMISDADDGTVTMTITLDDVWRFARVEENVKIQPYDQPPEDGNPVPGDFEYKYTAQNSPFVVEGLPRANYYGIHLDLEWESCE